MASSAGRHSDDARSATLHLLGELFGGRRESCVGARLWDGTRWPDESPRRATLVLKHPGTLRAMLLPGTELGLAEAFLYDDFDVEGELERVFELRDALAGTARGWRGKLKLARTLRMLPRRPRPTPSRRPRARLSGRRHSVTRDRRAVTYHYDVSNDFYALWLDRRMVYSSAYFHSADNELDDAQEQKLDHICRKLRLRPGQRLLDVGCGWGALVMHAARHYGVDATGITLSRPQAELASERIAEAGLAGSCRVEVRDYRELDEAPAYDALASVGMFEHVGAALLPDYFAKAWRLLVPGGVFLNHGIASCATEQPVRGRSFTDAYVFPDGELVPVHFTLRAAEEASFELRDVESLREHYALTLRHWVRRLEMHRAQALRHVDEPTYRVWRLFMSGSAHGFAKGRLNVYQTLLSRTGDGGDSGLPLTRRDWYPSDAPDRES